MPYRWSSSVSSSFLYYTANFEKLLSQLEKYFFGVGFGIILLFGDIMPCHAFGYLHCCWFLSFWFLSFP